MLAGALLLATSLPTQTIAVGVGGCACLSDNDHVESLLKVAYVGSVRAQYDHRMWRGVYLGLTASGEYVSRFNTQPGVALLGPVFVLRSGGEVSASLRVAGGAAYANDARWRASREPRNEHTFGWFLDASVEIAAKLGKDLDVFVDLSVLSFRNLKYRHAHPPGVPSWGYFSAGLPTMMTVGLRYSLK